MIKEGFKFTQKGGKYLYTISKIDGDRATIIWDNSKDHSEYSLFTINSMLDSGTWIPTQDSNLNALRYNDGKPRVSLIHNKSFYPLVEVLEFGADKYSPDNWKKPMDKIKILESMKRHVDELIDKVVAGESELDSESGKHIIGHIMSNTMFYSYHNVINKDSGDSN